MRNKNVAVAAALGCALTAGQARAEGCSPGIGPSCIGDVTRTTQPYRFGARRPSLVKAGPPIKASARYCVNGESRIGGTLWFYVDRSDLMLAGADVALPTGCRLPTLDTSEPD